MRKLTTCPGCGMDLTSVDDGRAGWWRFRLRIYDQRLDSSTPIVDSDPALPVDAPGEELVRGLWKLVTDAAAAAHDFHGPGELIGMTQQNLEKKIRGIRPTLSRCEGRATMRIEYDTEESYHAFKPPRFLARIDILKEEDPAP